MKDEKKDYQNIATSPKLIHRIEAVSSENNTTSLLTSEGKVVNSSEKFLPDKYKALCI